ncbi:MAG: response regulator transcription factor, partial [Xanthobacteraceae bacterium]
MLADDHPIVLDGLRNLIRAEDDFELVGEAGSGLTALKVIRETRPDVAVLDISMPELNGIVLSRRLTGEIPELSVLMLTLHEDRAYLNQALEAGVRGYVLKRSAVENLVHAIRAVMAGGIYVDPAISGRVSAGKRGRSKPSPHGNA